MTERAASKLGIALAVLASLGTSIAGAQPSAEARAEARTRFERGLELFEEQRYDAALAELSRAYELAPNWRVLFNIARSHAFLGRAVEAVAWYERFLSEGARRSRGTCGKPRRRISSGSARASRSSTCAATSRGPW
ncbi:MAG: hypothetical protein M5U28_18420 [Sandaracinaceae bacterium]|nr:hypothetical protein [Sandaracinaceae bacterium]